MRTKLIALAAAALFLNSSLAWAEEGKRWGFQKEQKAERQEFRQQMRRENQDLKKDLKGKTPEEKNKALWDYNQKRYQIRKDFQALSHEEKTRHLESKLSQNPKLSAEQKQQILDRRQQQYEENVKFRDEKQKAFADKFQQIQNDTSLTPEQKRQAMKQFSKEQKELARQHFESQKTENKSFREGIKSSLGNK